MKRQGIRHAAVACCFDQLGTTRVPNGALPGPNPLAADDGTESVPASPEESTAASIRPRMPAPKDDKPSGQAVEDYAKAIYALEALQRTGRASTTALADRLGVTPASASAMVKRLDALGA